MKLGELFIFIFLKLKAHCNQSHHQIFELLFHSTAHTVSKTLIQKQALKISIQRRAAKIFRAPLLI